VVTRQKPFATETRGRGCLFGVIVVAVLVARSSTGRRVEGKWVVRVGVADGGESSNQQSKAKLLHTTNC
jgi:hypothetical protein